MGPRFILASFRPGRRARRKQLVVGRNCLHSLYAEAIAACRQRRSEGPHLAEESVLRAGNDDFLSGWKNEENARGVEQARLLHVSQVDDIIARGAKESGTVEPLFAVVEGTLGENITISHVDACLLSGGFEKPDVRCPDQPAAVAVAQENEVIESQGAIVFTSRISCFATPRAARTPIRHGGRLFRPPEATLIGRQTSPRSMAFFAYFHDSA